MGFNKSDIFIGLFIVLAIVGGIFFYKRLKNPKMLPSPTPRSIDYKKEIEDSFNFDIPDSKNTINLKDISGGDARGIATDEEVLVDIEDPSEGFFYQAWLDDGSKLISLGKLRMAKGGWLLEYNRAKYPNSKKIIISNEKVFDSSIEKKILEGSF